MQWTTVGDVDIDIGANPSAEEAEEGVESANRKTVDIIESFRLNVCHIVLRLLILFLDVIPGSPLQRVYETGGIKIFISEGSSEICSNEVGG